MRSVSANGLSLPALGQGSWYIGDDPQKAQTESAALRRGIELGMNLIDTAEMYGSGRSELLIGRALNSIPREDYILCSKVYPHNAGKNNIFKSCENSIKRLGVDYLDLYLLHWRGAVPLEETVYCMEQLIKEGKIRRWGVSNFDCSDMEELFNVPNGESCAVDQVLYNIESRGIEFDLIPLLAKRDIAVMAYCPLAQAGALKRLRKDLLNDVTLNHIATKNGITVTQLMLAFLLRNKNVMAIPKAGSILHVEENVKTVEINISDEDWQSIDAEFLPPTSKMHLDME